MNSSPRSLNLPKKLADAQREIDELQAKIQTTREELVACSDQLADEQCELEDQRVITESKDKLLLDIFHTPRIYLPATFFSLVIFMKKKLLSDETIDELKQAVTKTIQGFEREL
jgi:hypothetical protein